LQEKIVTSDEMEELRSEIIDKVEEIQESNEEYPLNINLDWEEGYVFILKGFVDYYGKEANCKFVLYDFNSDNIPELILNYYSRYNLIYTFKNSKVIRLGDVYNPIYIDYMNDRIIEYGSIGTGLGGGSIISYDDDKLVLTNIFSYLVQPSEGIEEYSYLGEKLDEIEYDKKVNEIINSEMKM
jgi:hypothetical protein